MDKDGLKTDIEQEEIHCPFQLQQTVIPITWFKTKRLTKYKTFSQTTTY